MFAEIKYNSLPQILHSTEIFEVIMGVKLGSLQVGEEARAKTYPAQIRMKRQKHMSKSFKKKERCRGLD